ncbi:hypothetical protein SmJEL517_g05771 [Synchytrium microbalum]|uniref:Thymocyte nuclear protein 1 n=1 Tax=Synchytrium microbalum TaxID=1806994 RepID=A0A507BM27_9FUNG|nr:uncharacterized protein SmJEL517_g05771 [Synchytrium microbalum]TPX30727.1 hypothetical protein SmJEL517_g05771 [Synchytrium microbalum]
MPPKRKSKKDESDEEVFDSDDSDVKQPPTRKPKSSKKEEPDLASLTPSRKSTRERKVIVYDDIASTSESGSEEDDEVEGGDDGVVEGDAAAPEGGEEGESAVETSAAVEEQEEPSGAVTGEDEEPKEGDEEQPKKKKAGRPPAKKPKEAVPAKKKNQAKAISSQHDPDETKTRYFLLKAEPESRVVKDIDVKFSIDDLKEKGTSPWEGVRNYAARNIMMEMRTGDMCLFYHSNCKPPGVAGICKVVKEAYPDYTAWDETHPYFDPKTNKEDPKWHMVDVEFVRKLDRFIPLKRLQRDDGEELKNMALLKYGRLSVQPVSKAEFDYVLQLSEKADSDEE